MITHCALQMTASFCDWVDTIHIQFWFFFGGGGLTNKVPSLNEGVQLISLNLIPAWWKKYLWRRNIYFKPLTQCLCFSFNLTASHQTSLYLTWHKYTSFISHFFNIFLPLFTSSRRKTYMRFQVLHFSDGALIDQCLACSWLIKSYDQVYTSYWLYPEICYPSILSLRIVHKSLHLNPALTFCST